MGEAVITAEAERSNERANEARLSDRTEQIELRVRRERHRRWGPEEKLRIVRETLLPGTVIADVARRHGIGTGLLYTWRKAMLASVVSGFAPVEVQPAPSPAPPKTSAPGKRPPSGRIEIEFPDGVRVRVDSGVDDAVLRSVLAALDDR